MTAGHNTEALNMSNELLREALNAQRTVFHALNPAIDAGEIEAIRNINTATRTLAAFVDDARDGRHEQTRSAIFALEALSYATVHHRKYFEGVDVRFVLELLARHSE